MTKTLKSAWVTLDGLPLRVDFECDNGEVEVIQAWLEGWEILSIIDDGKISLIRKKLLNGEARETK